MEYREALQALQSGSLPSQLWFDGPERYLTDDFLEKIKDHLQLASDDFNLLQVEAKAMPTESLFDFVQSPPLLADAKLLIIDQAQDLQLSSADWKLLTAADPAVVIAYLGHGAKSIPKELRKVVTPVHMKKIHRGLMQKWIIKQFGLRGKRIAQDQITRVIDRTRYFEYNSTTDLLFLIQEIEKLAATEETVISAERIDQLLGRPLEDNIFSLLQSILDKDAHKSFHTLREYIASGANMYQVIPMLSRNYYQLHILKKLQAEGYPFSALGERSGIRSDFILRRMMASANRLSVERIQSDLNRCLEYEKIYKSESVRINEHVENLVLELMQSN